MGAAAQKRHRKYTSIVRLINAFCNGNFDMTQQLSLQWEVGHCDAVAAQPANWVRAQVPGAVQLDWARAHDWPPHWQADNYRAYEWMEDVYWTYRATLPPQLQTADGARVFLVGKGVDYQYQVRVNGEVVYEHEGMFSPFEIDVTGKSGALEIVVFPAPKSEALDPSYMRRQANQSCKPAVSYGWDFHPRLIPLGIWDECFIEVRPASHIEYSQALCELAEDNASASVSCDVRLSQASGNLRWTILDADGQPVSVQEFESPSYHSAFTQTINNPRLWWPNGQGEAHLYTSRLELLDEDGSVVDTKSQRFGARRVRLVMFPNAWDEPQKFPVTRNLPPVTIEVNGRQIFGKGSNWVCPDIFPGTLTRNIYAEHLQLARDAHFNLLRCWGGAIVNKDDFFELCDEMGLMVWQEFPLACNRYEGTPQYLRVLDAESREVITRLRHHPSIVIWCAGNELFNAWSRMTDQDAAIRLINRNTFDLDPSRPFLPTSPIEGIGHGDYRFRGPQGEVFQLFANARGTAYTEFGVPGPASVETLRAIIPEDELFPPRFGTNWQWHQGIDGWDGDPQSWLMQNVIEDYFGPTDRLEALVERGQLLQAEGYKCLFEEARRQKPRCAMSLNWCYNEPWPTAANNSLISWPCQPKPAYHAVKRSCRPVLASAKIPKFMWSAGEEFEAQLWLLNDAPQEQDGGAVEAVLRFGQEEIALGEWNFEKLSPNYNQCGPVVRAEMPSGYEGHFELLLRVAEQPEWSSSYTLLWKRNATA
jgi:beta-mannosidase